MYMDKNRKAKGYFHKLKLLVEKNDHKNDMGWT